MPVINKTCFKCGVEKPLNDFYKHPNMPDGHVNKCKVCNKKDNIENRIAKVDYYREYDRGRSDSNSPRVIKKRQKDKERYHNDPEFKIKILQQKQSWELNNAVKKSAHTAVGNALRDGKLDKPSICEHCNEEHNLQGHHWSYEQEYWLDVVWLCTSCHGKEHRKLNEINRLQQPSPF